MSTSGPPESPSAVSRIRASGDCAQIITEETSQSGPALLVLVRAARQSFRFNTFSVSSCERAREIELLAARARRLLVAVAPPRRHRELVVPLGLLRVAARQRDQVGLAALAVDDARRGVGEVEERDVVLLGVVVIVVVDRDALDADRVRALGVLVVGVRVAQLVAVHADVVVGPREVAAAAGAHGAVPDERVAAVVAEAMQRVLEAVRRRQHDVRRQQAAAAVERRLLQLGLPLIATWCVCSNELAWLPPMMSWRRFDQKSESESARPVATPASESSAIIPAGARRAFTAAAAR